MALHADEQRNTTGAVLFKLLYHIYMIFVEDQHVAPASGQGRLHLIKGQALVQRYADAETAEGRKIAEDPLVAVFTDDGYAFVGEVHGGDVYAVFGCAGKRDKVKRGVLGRIAGIHCSRVIVTEEDPRDEKAEDIGRTILDGVRESGCEGVFVENREEAIDKAVAMAGKGDLVLILGKGDEKYMYHEDGRVPWMGDNVAATKALRHRAENN